MNTSISAFGKAFLNVVFPSFCPICRVRLSGEKTLCPECLLKIRKKEHGIAACEYEGVIKEAVHIFKYRGVLSLLGAFSGLLLEFIENNIDMDDVDIIVPVPLHHAKLRERGFNQAYLLSLPIAGRYRKPVFKDCLIKKAATKPQSTLNRNRRLENQKGAFSVVDAGSIKAKRILLVDDVYTTGATVANASEALIEAGAASVKAITLACGT